MPSDAPAAGGPGVEPAEPARPPEGRHLHPLSILFGLGPTIKNLVVPGLFVLLTARRASFGWETAAMIFVIPATLAAALRYLSLSYRLGEGELSVRTGFLFRSERHVPYGRIHDLHVVQNPLHRLLSVAEVRVETAGGEAPEATLRVLSLAAVDELRQHIFAAPPAAEAGAAPAPPARRVLFSMRPRDLLALGFVENRGMVIVAAAMGLLWESGIGDGLLSRLLGDASPSAVQGRGAMRRAVKGIVATPSQIYDHVGVLLLAAAAFLLLVRLLSMAWAVARLHGFELSRDGDDLRLTYGALTRVSATIPLPRIQKITIHDGPLRRWLGRASVRVEAAGGREGDAGKERRELAPWIRREDVPALVRELEPGVDLDDLPWQGLHAGAERRLRRKLLLVALLPPLAAAFPTGGMSLLLLPPFAALALLHARRSVAAMGYAVTDRHLAFRSGWIRRDTSLTPHAKVQAVTLHASPFDRRRGMARLAVDTAGAGTSSHAMDVPYLDAALAGALHRRLAAQAAGTAFRW